MSEAPASAGWLVLRNPSLAGRQQHIPRNLRQRKDIGRRKHRPLRQYQASVAQQGRRLTMPGIVEDLGSTKIFQDRLTARPRTRKLAYRGFEESLAHC